ncbi:hypothetical protein ACU686_03130 [Yinghuangia aomiensis]
MIRTPASGAGTRTHGDLQENVTVRRIPAIDVRRGIPKRADHL